jgi:hypothetical protein
VHDDLIDEELNLAAIEQNDALGQHITSADKEIKHLVACIRRATGNDETLDAQELISQIGACSSNFQDAKYSKPNGSWPSSGSDEDDRLFLEFVEEQERLCDDMAIPRIPRGDIVKFAGLLSAPGMITLHYPPADKKNDLDRFKTTMNVKNVCIKNMLSKLGLSTSPDESLGHIAWVEQFFVKTSLEFRKYNEEKPYRAAFPKEIAELNLKFLEKLTEHSDYNVRLICGGVGVKADIEAATKNSDVTLFSLCRTPIYSQS